jgi:hypothetical protein
MASSIYKWLIVVFLGTVATAGTPDRVPHPLHLSVVEVEHNATDKTLEISCKIFTDDFERVLAQNYKTHVNLTNPSAAEKRTMDKLVSDYIQAHLSIKVDDRPMNFTYVGFEKQEEVTYAYVQADNIPSVKKAEVTDKLMQDLFTDQISLIHVIVGGNRKSTKLSYPATQAVFSF